jgi:hypothetical protein
MGKTKATAKANAGVSPLRCGRTLVEMTAPARAVQQDFGRDDGYIV